MLFWKKYITSYNSTTRWKIIWSLSKTSEFCMICSLKVYCNRPCQIQTKACQGQELFFKYKAGDGDGSHLCRTLLVIIELGKDLKNKINSALPFGDSNHIFLSEENIFLTTCLLSEKDILNEKWTKTLSLRSVAFWNHSCSCLGFSFPTQCLY